MGVQVRTGWVRWPTQDRTPATVLPVRGYGRHPWEVSSWLKLPRRHRRVQAAAYLARASSTMGTSTATRARSWSAEPRCCRAPASAPAMSRRPASEALLLLPPPHRGGLRRDRSGVSERRPAYGVLAQGCRGLRGCRGDGDRHVVAAAPALEPPLNSCPRASHADRPRAGFGLPAEYQPAGSPLTRSSRSTLSARAMRARSENVGSRSPRS